jgi:hypothetical protein
VTYRILGNLFQFSENLGLYEMPGLAAVWLAGCVWWIAQRVSCAWKVGSNAPAPAASRMATFSAAFPADIQFLNALLPPHTATATATGGGSGERINV